MFDAIYIGMSGLTSSSEGLTNISNNVANLNTPGFKGSQLTFTDLFYRYQFGASNGNQTPYSQGDGAKTSGKSIQFTQGDFRQTGNDLDAAIDGNGFFVVNKDGKTFYSRDGEFAIDANGYLTVKSDGARVSGYSGGGLTTINITGQRSNPPSATTRINFTGSLSNSSTTFQVTNLTVVDSLGKEHQLTLNLTNRSATTPGQWGYVIQEGVTQVSSGTVKYDGSGNVSPGYEQSTVTYSPGGGANSASITLDFSQTNYFSSSSSSLKELSHDGYVAGYLTKTAIDTDGYIVLSYSNGQTLKLAQVAIAMFTNLSALEPQGNSRFSAGQNAGLAIGAPGTKASGKLKVQGVEASNVDLAREFSELIVVQRAYQASSQVITTANEMIQQLGDIRGRR